jgi:hypothetical protein
VKCDDEGSENVGFVLRMRLKVTFPRVVEDGHTSKGQSDFEKDTGLSMKTFNETLSCKEYEETIYASGEVWKIKVKPSSLPVKMSSSLLVQH